MLYHRISNIGGCACISTGKKYAPISEEALINEGRFFASTAKCLITMVGVVLEYGSRSQLKFEIC